MLLDTTWGLVPDARTPLIGRDAELGELDRALRAVEEEKATRIVTVVGAQGIGKSRLIQDFLSRPHTRELSPALRVYRGSPRDTSAAFGLFARLLRSRFGLSEGTEAEVALAQIRTEVSQVLDDRKVGDVVYFIGQFLGLRGDDSPLTRAVADEPQEADVVRSAVMKAFIEADATKGPLCLVFEDVHAAHGDSMRLLRYLLEYVEAPVLFLCVTRPELLAHDEDFGRIGENHHRVVELAPLGDESAAELMRALLAPCVGGPPAELVDAACAFAGGTPILLEQMVRIYHDKGVIAEEAGPLGTPVFRVDLGKLADAPLPMTIDDAVNARLGALEPRERHVLEHAAAMGSVFWSGALLALGRATREPPDVWTLADDDVKEVASVLSDLVDRDYILRIPDSTLPGSEEFIFKHNREREAVRKRTPSAAARRYHAGIADWLDHQEAVRSSDEYVAMLAEHRDKGGDAIGAGLAYLEAGGVARARYASAKACEYFEKGLDLLGENHARRRIDALHDYGDVLAVLGRIDDALAAFQEMRTLAYRLDIKSKGGASHNRIGRLYRDTGSLDDAHRHLTAGKALFKASGDDRGVASSIDDIGKVHWLKGEYDEALYAFRDALSRRRRLADRRSIALSLNNMGLVLQDSGAFKEALEVFEQSLAIRREIGDLLGVVGSLNNLGTIAQDQRDFDKALALLREALDVAKQIGDRNRTALVLTNIGEAHYRSGNPQAAIEVLKQAEGLCDELGDRLGLAETIRGLGKAYMLNGDLAKARDCIGRAVELFAAVRSKVHLGVALRTLGEITAAGGWGSTHTKSAREYFARSASIFEQTGNDMELARTLKVFARFVTAEGTTGEGVRPEDEAKAMEARADEIFGRLKGASRGQ